MAQSKYLWQICLTTIRRVNYERTSHNAEQLVRLLLCGLRIWQKPQAQGCQTIKLLVMVLRRYLTRIESNCSCGVTIQPFQAA